MKHPAHGVQQCDSFWGGPAEIRERSADILLDAYADIDKKARRSLPLHFSPPPPPLIQARAAGPSNVEWNSCLITVWVWTRHSLSPPLSDAARPKDWWAAITFIALFAVLSFITRRKYRGRSRPPLGWCGGGRSVGFSSVGWHTWLACCSALSIRSRISWQSNVCPIPGSVRRPSDVFSWAPHWVPPF